MSLKLNLSTPRRQPHDSRPDVVQLKPAGSAVPEILICICGRKLWHRASASSLSLPGLPSSTSSAWRCWPRLGCPSGSRAVGQSSSARRQGIDLTRRRRQSSFYSPSEERGGSGAGVRPAIWETPLQASAGRNGEGKQFSTGSLVQLSLTTPLRRSLSHPSPLVRCWYGFSFGWPTSQHARLAKDRYFIE
jgi:hypothetical protein